MMLPVLYQDEALIAVDKPPGMLVHRSMIAKDESVFALQVVRDQIGQYVYPVHRLDRPTSGVLLFAKNPNVARLLTESFTHRQVEKQYSAFLRGFLPNRWSIDYPLTEIHDKMTDARARKDKPPQSAQSELNCLKRFEVPLPIGRYPQARFSLVNLTPYTGRKHQLRRHMAHIRHPILGDTTHGDGKQNKFLRHHFNFHQLALTCTNMLFRHPLDNCEISIEAPLSVAFTHLLDAMSGFELGEIPQLTIHKKTND